MVTSSRNVPYRSLGPVLLGSATWIYDEPLIERIGNLSGECIIARKVRRNHPRLEYLRGVAERLPGMPTVAFYQLTELAPKVDGAPLLVGPWTPMHAAVVPAIRALGYRRPGNRLPPIIHAKLALLGSLWWHDAGGLGDVEDVIGFEPKRLWVSSANFTQGSRKNLEFGYWTSSSSSMARGH